MLKFDRFVVLALVATSFAGATSVANAEFMDNFSGGVNSSYWTLSQSTAGLYTYNTPGTGIDFARVNSTVNTLQNITMTLNLAAVAGSSAVSGDFSASVDFSNGSLGGPGTNQAELQTFYSNSDLFIESVSNESGFNVHVFDGAIKGYTTITSNHGNLTVQRVGSTVSAYYNGNSIYSKTETADLTTLRFVLQNNVGHDPISVSFNNFTFSPSSVPEPSSFALLGLGAVGLSFGAYRRRNRAAV